MRKQLVTLALAGGLGLGGAALLAPGIASAADSTTGGVASSVADRVSHLKAALAGLVSNGTITQAQADKVATTLADTLPGRGHGGPRAGHVTPEATAKILGITVEELRTAMEAGKTLAQVAADNGVSKADLISKLVAAAKTQLAADVKAGTITQAQADEIASGLTARITEKVDRVGHGPGGHHGHGPRPDAPSTSTPSTTAPSTTSPSA